LQVGLTKVIAFEQQWLSHRFRQSVRKTVAEVESSGMPALAKVRECLTGKIGLIDAYGFDIHLGVSEKFVRLANGGITTSGFRDHRGFDKGSGRNVARVRIGDCADENLEAWFAEDNRQNGGSI